MISNRAQPSVVPNLKSNKGDDEVDCRFAVGGQIKINEQYECLQAFLADGDVPVNKSSSRKLARLTIGQLNELLTDICDEIERRARRFDKEPFLNIRLEYSPKRNQARQKLADLGSSRFVQLVASVQFELERRFPDIRSLKDSDENNSRALEEKLDERFEQLSRSLASLPELSNSCYQLSTGDRSISRIEHVIEASTTESSGALSATLTTPKCLDSEFETKNTLQNQGPVEFAKTNLQANVPVKGAYPRPDIKKYGIEERLARGQTFNFDCLDSLIQDLNAMIGVEQTSEIETLKQRHAQEIAALKEYTQHLEEHILPAKNHEIARHAARVEELEGRLVTARRENANYTTKLSERERLVEEQAALIKTIQSAYMQLQNQLACSSLVLSPRPQPSENHLAGNLLANSVGVFAAIWTAFSKVHESALRIMDDPAASITDRLSGLKDACALAQKLVRDGERLISRLDTERMPWIAADIEAMINAKTCCMQALSYCVVCCKDMGGRVKADREVREAVAQLARHVRGLVDAAELVASRAQIPSSPMGNGTAEQQAGSRESLPKLSSEISPLERLRALTRSKLEPTMAAFHSLRTFVESQSIQDPHLLIELPTRMRANLAEALSCASEIQQSGREIIISFENPREVEKNFVQLGDGVRKLQLCILNGTGILAEESLCNEAVHACRTINAALRELQQCITAI